MKHLLTIEIKKSGSNNIARILREGITASSTNSPEVARDSAVAKLMARNGLKPELTTITNQLITSLISHETWLVTLRTDN